MACEDDAKEIVDLALEPVCRRPDFRHGRHRGMILIFFAYTYFQAQFVLIAHREQVVDHVIARGALQPVYRRYIRQVVIMQIFLQICADRYQRCRLQHNRLLATESARFDDCLRELFPYRCYCRYCCYSHITSIPCQKFLHLPHRTYKSSLVGPTSFRPLAFRGSGGLGIPSRILRCSSLKPKSSISGVGGQPGMNTSTGTILSTPCTMA